jgi:hypothetical protein
VMKRVCRLGFPGAIMTFLRRPAHTPYNWVLVLVLLLDKHPLPQAFGSGVFAVESLP